MTGTMIDQKLNGYTLVLVVEKNIVQMIIFKYMYMFKMNLYFEIYIIMTPNNNQVTMFTDENVE